MENQPSPQQPKGYKFVWPAVIVIVLVLAGLMGVLAHQARVNKYKPVYEASSSTYGGIQVKARDTKRQTDMSAIQAQLEVFYTNNGYYPSLTNVNDSEWLATNMKNLDPQALIDPLGAPDSKLISAPQPKSYAYQPTTKDGKSCEADATLCAKYTLTAELESGTAYSKRNLD